MQINKTELVNTEIYNIVEKVTIIKVPSEAIKY